MNFGERLRELRKRADMTQEKLARAADVSNATVFKLETVEGQDPSWSTVRKLARALGVSVAEFDVQEEPEKQTDEGARPSTTSHTGGMEESDRERSKRTVRIAYGLEPQKETDKAKDKKGKSKKGGAR